MKNVSDLCYRLIFRLTLLSVSLLSLSGYAQDEDSVYLTNNTIAENQPTGTTVGTLEPNDASFTLPSGLQNNDAFIIGEGNVLLTNLIANYEVNSVYTVLVEATLEASTGEDSLVNQTLTVSVLDRNDAPVITGQAPLSTAQEAPLTLTLEDLQVRDEDEADAYPAGYALVVRPGNNYTVADQTITPTAGFAGALAVPVLVTDGDVSSELFNLVVNVSEVVSPSFTLSTDAITVAEDFTGQPEVIVTLDNPTQQSDVDFAISPPPAEVDFATLTASTDPVAYRFASLPNQNGQETFTITATHRENNRQSAQDFQFSVTPLNDAPLFEGVANNNQTIDAGAELQTLTNFATNTAPAPPSATDEADQAVRFVTQVSNPDIFATPPAISSDGTLTYQPASNQAGTATVSVVLEDDGENTGENVNTSAAQSFDIIVEAPQARNLQLDGTTVSENQADAVVGTLSANTNVPFTTINYELTGSEPAEGLEDFRIDGDQLITNRALDFEGISSYDLVIRAKAGFGDINPDEKTFTITVTNLEEPPTDILLSNNTVSENSPDALVGALSTVGGAEVPVAYALVAGEGSADNASFTIANNNELRTATALDAEAKAEYTIRVQATGDGSLEKVFTITVVNETEPPTDITLSNDTVAENAPAGTAVGTLTATGGATTDITYSLSGEGAANFTVVDDVLQTTVPLNFEENPSYPLTISATGDGTYDESFTITVTNVEEPPTDIILSNNTVEEDQETGTVVGTLSATESEVPVTFALVEGNGSTDNNSFRITDENELVTNAIFDFEGKSSYSIRVRATGDGSLEKTFTITIVNREDRPTDIQLSASIVAENAPAGTVVGQLSATGGDGPYSYRVLNDETRFAINEANQLVTTAPFDFETTPEVTITIEASNADGPSEKDFTITITNQPEPPSDITLSSDQIEENQPVGTAVGTLDIEGGQGNATYTLVPGNNDNNQFVIEGNELRSNASFDFETKSSYTVRIRATSDGAIGKTFTINVINIVEPPTDISLSSTTVAENQPEGTTVGELSAEGGEGDITFALVGGSADNTFFQINGDQLQTRAPLDAETQASYNIRVRATGDGAIDQNFTITVTNVDEPPVLSGIERSFLEFSEGQAATTVSQTIAVADVDSDIIANITASISNNTYVQGEDELVVEGFNGTWDPEQGILTIEGPLNLAEAQRALRAVQYLNRRMVNPTASTRRITFRVSDGTNQSNVQERFIRVSDSNIPPELQDVALTTPEGTPLTLTRADFAAGYQGDADGTGFSGVIYVLTLPQQGSLTVNERAITDTDLGGQGFAVDLNNNTLVYTPNDNFNQTDRFEWNAYDNLDAPGIAANVIITVAPQDDPPVLTAPTSVEVPLTGEVLVGGISVAEADNDSIRITLAVLNGTLSVPEPARSSVTFTEGTGEASSQLVFEGSVSTVNEALNELRYTSSGASDTLAIIASDAPNKPGASLTDEATVLLIDNQPPVVSSFPVTVSAAEPYRFSLSQFNEHYSDPDNLPSAGGLVTLSILSLPQKGTFSLSDEPLTQATLDQEGSLNINAAEVDQLTYTVAADSLGTDTFTWTASDGAETAATLAQVTITISNLTVSLGADVEQCANVPLTLTASVSGTGDTFVWFQNNTPIPDETTGTITVTPSQSIQYVVQVTNAQGNVASDTLAVSVTDCPTVALEVPSGFTPDGDGTNETWVIENISDYEQRVVEIYDRFGHQIFRSEGYQTPWDGTYQGELLPVGTYYYLIILNGGETTRKGSVTILR